MKKYVPIDKRSKKEQKEYNKKQRTMSGFNTGTRTMQDKRHPSRVKQRDAERKNKIYD